MSIKANIKAMDNEYLSVEFLTDYGRFLAVYFFGCICDMDIYCCGNSRALSVMSERIARQYKARAESYFLAH